MCLDFGKTLKSTRWLAAGGTPGRLTSAHEGGGQKVTVWTWTFFRNPDTKNILKNIFEIGRFWKSIIQFTEFSAAGAIAPEGQKWGLFWGLLAPTAYKLERKTWKVVKICKNTSKLDENRLNSGLLLCIGGYFRGYITKRVIWPSCWTFQ